MLIRTALLAVLIVPGADFILGQNPGAGAAGSPSPAQVIDNGPPLEALTQAQVQDSGPSVKPPAQPQAGGPTYKNADQLLAAAGSAVPGFGGYYPDKNAFGIAHVYMLDTSQLEAARRALEMVVGADRVARDIREVRTVQGLYSMTQLSQWYQSLTMSYIKGNYSDRPGGRG